MKSCTTLVLVFLLSAAVGCGSGYSSMTAPGLSVALSPNSAAVYQDQSRATVNVTLTLEGVPTSVSPQIQSPGTGNSASITFTALPPASPPSLGTFRVNVIASYGPTSGSASLQLTVGAYVQLGSAPNGQINLAMSTSFQPA